MEAGGVAPGSRAGDGSGAPDGHPDADAADADDADPGTDDSDRRRPARAGAGRSRPREAGVFDDEDEDDDLDGGRIGEGLEASTAAVVIPALLLLPVSLVTLFPVWVAIGLVVSDRVPMPPYPLFFLGYLALGLTTFTRPVARGLLVALYGARTPTASERRDLRPVWKAVLRRTRLPRGRFTLLVVDDHDLCAVAVGGPIVLVTTGAINGLAADELEGVLAHELAHHLGPHDVVLSLSQWLAAPLVWLGSVGDIMSKVGCLIMILFGALFFLVVPLLGVLAGAAVLIFALVLLVGGRVAGLLGNLVGRHSEYYADALTVDLGFGEELAGAIDRFLRQGYEADRRRSVGQRLFGNHPPLPRRLSRINRRVAEDRGDR
jgi:STE24 endopeptidase